MRFRYLRSCALVRIALNYYNENDPKAAQWLKDLIWVGAISDGEVDTRSIEDVTPNDLLGYRQCHFFAGIGGWSLALRLAGWPDDQPVWTGSCPCQPFSAAGKSGGFADERHLWPVFYHLIEQRKPTVVFGEQVASAAGIAWLDLVQTDLEAAHYAFGPIDITAAGAGFNSVRNRLFWVAADANSHGVRWERVGPLARWEATEFTRLVPPALRTSAPTGPYSLRDDGLPGSMGLLRGLGNAIVPPLAAEFIGAYLDTI